MGLLTRITESEWGTPTFVIPKKDGTIRFLTNFRGLNNFTQAKTLPFVPTYG